MNISWKNIVVAVKSRCDYKKERTEEQKRRLKICEACPLNSNNKEQLKIKDKVMMFLNKALNWIMGVEVDDEAICTDCGCNLIHKSTQEDVELKCPQKKW